MPAVPYPFTQAGKPFQAGDFVTATGTVVSVTGSGPTAVVVIKWSGSGNLSSTTQAQDIAAGGQTL